MQHAKVETKKQEVPKKNIRCSFCNRLFMSEEKKTRHMKSAHGPKYKCSYKNCKRKYSSERDLKPHMKIHTLSQDKLYKCTQCEKSFQLKSELKTHKKSHSDFKEFVCHTCGKEFKHKGMLNRHAEVHSLLSNYFSFPVEGCDVSRNNVDLINKHVRLNHGCSKLYMCGTCHKVFNFRDGK